MVDVTGGTPPTGASPFDVPGDLADVYAHFGDASMFSVATAASLPVSGNWAGRSLFVQDTGRVYVWDGSWLVVAAKGSETAITLTNSGGTTYLNQTYPLTVRTRGDVCLLNGRVSRSAGTGTVVGVVPSGFRPSADVVDAITSVAPANTLGPTFSIGVSASTGEISLASLGGGSGTWNSGIWIPINMQWVR